VDVHVELARSGDEELVLHAVLNGVETASVVQAHESTGIVHLEVPEPELWWPRGLGDQALSTIEVTLTDTEGHALDTVCRRVGFRTVAIDTTPDAEGTPFVLRVNGTDIRVRGANWTPDDALVHRVTRDRLAQRLAQAEYANVNLLRIWGGGVFESDDLYELCDEAGMLVWQDFLFACAAYADEGPLADEVEAEARENVARLASHPALVVWNGNNENLWGYEDWSWMARLDGASWGSRYYEDLLPAIVRELSPHVPYTPGSPFSAGVDAHPNDPRHGTVHIWDVWNTVDYSAYVDNRPRFVAEFGWQGPPTWTTLTRAVHDSPLTPESPGVMTHQKAAKGNDKLLDGLVPHFRSPQRMRDWHWAMQLNQAVAMRFGIEHLRSLAPHCSGMIMWQFNDCWPVTSWAAVDGDGRRKPLLDALRRAYADRLITIQPRDGALSVVAVNDGTTPWSGRLEIARRSFDGDMLGSFGADVNVPPGSAVTVAVPQDVTESHDPTREYLRAHLDGAEVARRLYVEPRDAVLRDRPFTATAERENDVWLVRVRATSLVVDLALLADSAHPDAVAYGSLVWLDAGSEALITVSASVDLPSDALVSASVLRCANDLCQEVKANGGEDLGRAIPSI
jgi:beta-mannosidase